MSKRISRREFIIKSSGGLTCAVIAPDFIRQAIAYHENTNQPLLVPPKKVISKLCAVDGGDGFQLNVGNPYEAQPPVITWREYIKKYVGDDIDAFAPGEVKECFGISFAELDQPCTSEDYKWNWIEWDGPHVQAVDYLNSLDLGPFPSGGGEPIGGLKFYDGPMPGSNYVGVHAEDEISLSCLQERLKELGEATEIVLG